MTFTVNSLTRCSGQNHWTLVITVGGSQYTIETTPEEMSLNPGQDSDAARAAVLVRVRSAAKEAGATNFAQSRTAVEGKIFQI